jgi:2-iminoacetate synthase ThiH
MSGIYIHIPYCTQKCIYCNFYSIATKKSKDNYIKTLIKEIEKRNTYLSSPIKTLYFGGGTPTCLNKEQLEAIGIKKLSNGYARIDGKGFNIKGGKTKRIAGSNNIKDLINSGDIKTKGGNGSIPGNMLNKGKTGVKDIG